MPTGCRFIRKTEVTVRTWERGSGITLACGHGGVRRPAWAGVLTGRTARKVLIHLPGGDLQLEWREKRQTMST